MLKKPAITANDTTGPTHIKPLTGIAVVADDGASAGAGLGAAAGWWNSSDVCGN